MELVRKYLTADEIGTPTIRWNSDCDCVQQSPDGGVTWVDVPQADPRSAAGYAMPPASSDNPQCDGAERMIAALKRLIDIVVQSAGSVAAVSAVLGYLADFLFGIGTLVALILEAVTGMLALGQEVLDAAFTTDVYDQIKCLAFARLGVDGHFDDTGWTGFQSDVLGAFGGTVNIAMGLIFQLEGINGFNNAASVGTETGDCTACTDWCVIFDFRTGDHGFAWAYIDSVGNRTGAGWETSHTEEDSGDSSLWAQDVYIQRDLTGFNVTHMTAVWKDAVAGSFAGAPTGAYAAYVIHDSAFIGRVGSPAGDFTIDVDVSGDAGLLGAFARMSYAFDVGDAGGNVVLESITIYGNGDKPTGGDDC